MEELSRAIVLGCSAIGAGNADDDRRTALLDQFVAPMTAAIRKILAMAAHTKQ